MRLSSPSGYFTVWDQTTDSFSHSQLAANWDKVDQLFQQVPKQVEVSATVPTSGNFAGRMVMLSSTVSGFAAWTLIRYDGSNWRPVGAIEVASAVPTQGNWAGRIVILSQSSGGFDPWSVIRYDGSNWGVVGGFSNINLGGVNGLQTTGDIWFATATRGPVLTDRATGAKWRLYMNNGDLSQELVS